MPVGSTLAHIVPASPSWYCSQVLDCSDAGIVCYGAKNTVFVWDIERDPPVCLSHFFAHQDRVVGLSLRRTTTELQCCTAGEDGRVRVWSVEGHECRMLKEHQAHAESQSNKNAKKPTCIQWSPLVSDLIISGDDRGTIVLWRIDSDELRTVQPENAHIFCIACSPNDPNLLAVGYRTGAVVIIDMSKKSHSIVQRLKGHDEEIHCIVWCPILGEIISAEGDCERDTTGCLLATGSRDRTVRIWSFTKGRPIHTLKLPTNTGHSRGRYDESKNRAWVTVHWLSSEPWKILSSSFNGELIQWDVSQAKPQWKALSSGEKAATHNRIVFNMTVGGTNSKTLTTTSMDRNIVTWDLDTLQAKSSIPTLGGFVYCLALSPFQPGCLAVGVGDNMIRIWKTDNPTNPLCVQSHWQGIRSKVTALGWHPNKEGKLAYGTDDGRVGIMDMLSHKSPLISSSYHKYTVYVVTWGPACTAEEADGDYVLYSCGDGVVWQHVPWSLDKEATNLTSLIAKANNIQGKMPGRSEISWKSDFSVFALGNDDGSVDVIEAKTLLHLASIQVHRKLVNCVRWHPMFTSESPAGSPASHWLASGTNDAAISVVNLAPVFEKLQNGGLTAPSVIMDSFVQLEGHTNRITSLSWSPHKDGVLASASYDGSSQVWDVKNKKGVANFRDDQSRFLCVVFSDIDPDVVYSGCNHSSLFAWRPSEQTHTMPPASKKKKKKRPVRAAVTQQAKDMKEHKPEAMVVEDVVQEVEHNQDSTISPSNSFDEDLVQLRDELETVEVGKAIPNGGEDSVAKDAKKRKLKSLFPKSNQQMNRGKGTNVDDCVELARVLYSPDKTLGEENFHLGAFCSRKDNNAMLNREIDHHVSSSNQDHQLTLLLMQGSLVEVLEEAASKKQLNDSLLAMAPMASTQIWRELSVKYAFQLEEKGQIVKAASHMMAANKIYDAINLLCRNGHYREALCLAQARLSPMDPQLKSICQQWSYVLAKDGNLELAAKCHLAVNEPLQAVKLLTKRNNLVTMQAAIKICLYAGELGPARNYAKKCVQQYLNENDFAAAENVALIDTKFKYLELYVSVHQALTTQLHKMGSVDDGVVKSAVWMAQKPVADEGNDPPLPILLLDKIERDVFVSLDACCMDECHFVVHLISQLYASKRLQLDVQQLEEVMEAFEDVKTAHQGQNALQEMSLLVTMGLVHLLLGNPDGCCTNWAQALSVCLDADEVGVAESLCRLLLPTGPTGVAWLQSQLRALRITKEDKIDKQISQLSDHERKNCIEKELDLGLTTTGVTCEADTCTPGDSLITYYALTVLRSQKAPADVAALTRSLLWNLQAKKFACHEALTRISCATATLITTHASGTPKLLDSVEDDMELGAEASSPENEGVETLIPEVVERLRHESGECATMEGDPGVVLPVKPHQKIPRSPMKLTGGQLEPLRVRRRSSENSSEDDYEKMQDLEGNPVCSELCQIFERKEEEEESGEWNLSLPVDLHYQTERVSLVWLAEEQLKIQQWLSEANVSKSCPFPNPVISAKVLLPYLSKHDPTRVKPVLQWAIKHAYLQEQIHEFENYDLPSTNDDMQ